MGSEREESVAAPAVEDGRRELLGRASPTGGGAGSGGCGHVPLYMPIDLQTSEVAAIDKAVSADLPRSGSLSWGLHACDTGGPGPAFEIRGNLEGMRRLNEVILEVSLRAGRGFLWSSLQLLRNLPSVRHVDADIGESLIMATGSFEGGGLRCDGRADLGLRNRAVFFAPSSPHSAAPHSGDRVSVVAYLHPMIADASADLARALRELGFMLGVGDRPGIAPPSRVMVTRDSCNDPDTVYIGRGHAGLGLGRSPWANPFPISPGNPRKKVIKAFKMYLERSPDLVGQLGALSGKRLACHCPLDIPCHGDVLIDVFRDRFCAASVDPPVDQSVEELREFRRAEAAGRGCPKLVRAPTEPTIHVGIGDPLMVQKGQQRRPLVDGGGLCSKGLWPPDSRGPVSPLGANIREEMMLALARSSTDPKDVLRALADPSSHGDPFPAVAIEEARDAVRLLVAGPLKEWTPVGGVLDQNVEVRLIGALLRAFGDPDWEVFKEYEIGVRVGVGVRPPRTPLVFPEKVRWNVPGQESADAEDVFVGTRVDNYASARERRSEVRKVLEDQASRGQAEIMTERAAQERFGARLSIASLAAIVKGVAEDGGAEIRIVHDGTNGVGVNGTIKVMDHIPLPASTDVQRAMRYCEESGVPYYAFTADVAEAHRQIKVFPDDAGYQACQLEPGGPVYVNLVGTYGIASAGYWWGRLGAAVLRLHHYVFGGDLLLWIFLYADDWLLLTGGRKWIEGGVLALMLIRVLGLPLSWKKVGAGFVAEWIGLEINVREWSLGLSARRAAWVGGWLGRTLEAGSVQISELSQAVGRMQFAYGALIWDRPFLAPLYTLMHLYPSDAVVELPGFVKAAMHWLKARLEVRRTMPCGRLVLQPEAIFRVDAKAAGRDVAIGGWMPFRDEGGAVIKEKSPWFAARITPENAPCAFDRGEPFRTVSALELLATVVALILFRSSAAPGTRLQTFVSASAHTDSAVATHVLGRAPTTSFPLCLVAMEAAAQLEERGMDLSLEWVPREVNAEADSLSNFKFAGFAAEKRIEFDIASLPFLVFPQLLADATDFYGQARVLRAAVRGRKRGRALRPGDRLKVRDPW